MLKELSIRNFAIIDDLQISFPAGFTILSGETGAGKSIILNGVNLLLGSRASNDLIRTGADAAELEALFDIGPQSSVALIMAEHGYNAEEGLLIRRIISSLEGNRVYINGRLATIQVLNAVTESLASISGQHAHQGLLKEDQHLLILDQFGRLMALREKVLNLYQEIVPLTKRLDELIQMQSRQTEKTELLEFQKNEITLADLVLNEDSELEEERLRLKNAEVLYETAHTSLDTLYSAPGSIFENLVQVRKDLDKAARIDPQLKIKSESIAEAVFQIEDGVEGLRAYLNTVQHDEKRLEEIEERLHTLNKLKRKYGGSLDAVGQTLDTIIAELAGIENLAEKITSVEKRLYDLQAALAKHAMQLSKKRKQTANDLAKKVIGELETLKMANTEFKVSLRGDAADDDTNAYLVANNQVIYETGIDRATFMIAPNVGETLKPLAGIASGGELSRVVLALKSILAVTESVETVVFDEVDAGIGGGVAEVVGRKLADLSKHHQIICITHLPQIAKFGDYHFSISKLVSKGRTRTVIKSLDPEERQAEIARMLGGEEITEATMNHARELLEK